MGGKGSGRPRKNKAVDQVIEKITQPEATKIDPLKEKIEKLKFIRIYDFGLIPKYLLEQVQKRVKFDMKELYAMAPNFEKNPMSLLYVMADEDHKIKGFIWLEIDTIEKKIHVPVLTVDREYQDRGEIIKKCIEFFDPIRKKSGFDCRIITRCPHAFERAGFKKTGQFIMDY